MFIDARKRLINGVLHGNASGDFTKTLQAEVAVFLQYN